MNEEKAAYIQNRAGITICDTHFISREGAKCFNYPTYWYNNGKGGHIDVVKLEGIYYLTQTTIKPYEDPIPYGRSGKVGNE
jgi:hypothetical protein